MRASQFLDKTGVKILMDKHSIKLPPYMEFQFVCSAFHSQKNQTRWKKLKISANYMGNKLNENKLDDVFPGSCISKAFIWPLHLSYIFQAQSYKAQTILSTCES